MTVLEQRMMETIINYLPELIKRLERQNEIFERMADAGKDDHETK